MQGVKSNYDTDLIRPIIDFIATLAGKEYVQDSRTGMSMRVIADHARATAFSIADGVSPGNGERNYVLRKIMRRAIYHGVRALGLEPPFFHKITEFVIEFMAGPYPELISVRPAIEQIVRDEERRFIRILAIGEPRLVRLLEDYAPEIPPMLELARTYDTFGVPRDLIRVVLDQHGFVTTEEEFKEEFNAALRELQQQSAPATGRGFARCARNLQSGNSPAAPD
jgi:alanyl-tRNA synthetase